MDYRTAYEELSKALWRYERAQNDAYVNLMLAVREIEKALDESLPLIVLEIRRNEEVPCEKNTRKGLLHVYWDNLAMNLSMGK